MRSVVPDAGWAHLSRFIAEAMGLHFPRARWDDLQRGMAGAAAEFGFDDVEACVAWLLSGPAADSRIQVLAHHLTVGETYFFRDRPLMEAVAAHVLIPLIEERRGRDQRLRLWSAACCTGEEPYSLAILLHRLLPDLQDWDITILATDINARFLRRAAAGVYGEWSFRDAPPGFKERYFTPTVDGRHAVIPEIGRLVSFARLNLAGDSYPSPATGTQALDLIFCRNVLMYFKPVQIERVVGRLHRALIDGGWLAVSPSEACETFYPRFAAHTFPAAILHRRSDADPRNRHSIDGHGRRQTALPAPRDLLPEPGIGGRPFDASPPAVLGSPPSAVAAAADSPSPALSVAAASADVETAKAAPQPVPAQSLYAQGRYREAVDALLPQMEQGSHEPALLSLLTRSLANLGRLDEALPWCDRWIAADKLGVEPRYLHGLILLERGDAEGARSALHGALYLQPDFVLAHYALGNLAREDGRGEEARRHFANALQALQGRDPDEPLSETDGLTARRLAETLVEMSASEVRRAR